MNVLQTNTFRRTAKKLHSGQKKALDIQIRAILDQPEIGKLKTGDLCHVRVHKYKHADKQYLLAYTASENDITLLAIGSHENFYRDLKK